MKFLVFLVLIHACNTSKPDSSGQDTIRVKLNETFEIKLGAVMGTGYRWLPADSAYKQFLRLDSSYVVQITDIDGNPETQVFVFEGIKKGTPILHMAYRRSWKKNEPPDKEKKYTVIIE